MKILISTGIYPPKTSGPAQYAFNMNNIWTDMGHEVWIKTYTVENKLPTGIRHIWYFIKIIPLVIKSDVIFALDTYSVGFPSVLAAKIFGRKVIIRTGGDFLWESYVERTGELVLLSKFYNTSVDKFSLKEKIVFNITKWTLNNVDLLVFSTEWQRNIFLKPYGLESQNVCVVENHYDRKSIVKSEIVVPKSRTFISGTRPLKWKNIDIIMKVFEKQSLKSSGAILDNSLAPYAEFIKKMKDSYAIILVSLGDISPHMILDAISLNKPFILTRENGLNDRISEIALLVDPKNELEIEEKVLWLLDENNYKSQVEKIKCFSFVHTWHDIANEYIKIFNQIK